jgi:hypothetical protein
LSAVNSGLSVGVTLPVQASKVVEAVSGLLLASRRPLADFNHSNAGESEAIGEPASSRASAMPRCEEMCSTVAGLSCVWTLDITETLISPIQALQRAAS